MDGSYEIRRIPVWPVARLIFLLLLVVGILVAVIFSMVFSGLSLLANFGGSHFGDDFAVFQKLGLVMIPIIAFSYAVFGTVGVVIWILIYNLIASVVGGIELDLKHRGGEGIRPARISAGSGDIPQAPDRPSGG